jgi:hypothetical protein
MAQGRQPVAVQAGSVVTDQEQIDADFDRRSRKVNWIFWPIYIGLLTVMIYVTVVSL